MHFIYENREDGIYIAGPEDAGKIDEIVYIPEQIDQLPVVGIKDHAFFEIKSIREIILPDSVRVIEPYAFAECRGMYRIRMSEEICSIDDYAFYNCHALESIDLFAGLRTMGYGAFKNCSELKLIRLYTDGVNPLVIGALLDDNSHEIGVDLYDDKKTLLTKLVFTEFDYDCILQVEARQFDWVYHGSGNVFRQCISAKGVDFEKYDSLFASAVREDWPETAMAIALGRILYPYRLDEKYRVVYLEFLKEHRQKVFEQLLKCQDMFALETLLPQIALEDDLTGWIDQASKIHRFEFVSLLMDFRQKTYGMKKKSFEL